MQQYQHVSIRQHTSARVSRRQRIPGHARNNVSAIDDAEGLHPQRVEKARELGVSDSRRAKRVHPHAPQLRRLRIRCVCLLQDDTRDSGEPTLYYVC